MVCHGASKEGRLLPPPWRAPLGPRPLTWPSGEGLKGSAAPSCLQVARITGLRLGRWCHMHAGLLLGQCSCVLGLSSCWGRWRGWGHCPWVCPRLSFCQGMSTSGCCVLEDIRVALNVCLGFPQQEWPILKVAVTSRAWALAAGPWRRGSAVTGRIEYGREQSWAAPGLSWVSFISGGS